MKALLSFLRSLKLSLALMVFLIPVLAGGNLIPQIGRDSSDYIGQWRAGNPVISKIAAGAGFDHVYTSWWFLLVSALLFLNMALITFPLAGKTRRRAKGLHRYTDEAPEYFLLQEFPYSDSKWGALRGALREKRYGLYESPAEIYGRKGWAGIWGGTILHLGFLVLFAGAAISALTRFSGYTEVGEGQGVIEDRAAYLNSSHGLLFRGNRPFISLWVRDIEEKDIGKIKTVASTVEVLENGKPAVSKNIRMNSPLYYRGLKVYQSRYAGPALLFSVEDRANMSNNLSYLNLKRDGTKAVAVFPVTGTDLQAKVEREPGSQTIEFELRRGGKLLYQGPLATGQAVDSGPLRIRLEAINKWAGLTVVYDDGVNVIFAGFGMCVLGIAVMGLFDPKEIWVRKTEKEGKETVKVLGWGRWRNMFLDEFEEIKKRAGICTN